MFGNSGPVGIYLGGITKGSFRTGHSGCLKGTGSGGLKGTESGGLGSSCLRGLVVIGGFGFVSTGIGLLRLESGGLGNSSGTISGISEISGFVAVGIFGTVWNSGFLCSPFNGHIAGGLSPVLCLIPLVVILHSSKVFCDSILVTLHASVFIDFISVHLSFLSKCSSLGSISSHSMSLGSHT